MGDKLFDWLVDKCGSEEFSRAYLYMAYGAILYMVLFWSALGGQYFSALLNLMNVKPLSFLADGQEFYNMPMYAYILGIVFGVLFFYLFQILSKKYFLYACGVPRNKSAIENILSSHSAALDGKISAFDLAQRLSFVSKELQDRRGEVKRMLCAYMFCGLTGLILIISAFFGNILDFLIGFLFVVAALFFLYKSVGIFIKRVAPWYAEYNNISNNVKSISDVLR